MQLNLGYKAWLGYRPSSLQMLSTGLDPVSHLALTPSILLYKAVGEQADLSLSVSPMSRSWNREETANFQAGNHWATLASC